MPTEPEPICSLASLVRRLGISKPTLLYYRRQGVITPDFIEDDLLGPRYFWRLSNLALLREQLIAVCQPAVVERIKAVAEAETNRREEADVSGVQTMVSVQQVTDHLLAGEFAVFGDLIRAQATAYFAVQTLPPPARSRLANDAADLIAWIWLLDAALDSCPDEGYAADLLALLEHVRCQPSVADYRELKLAHDPAIWLPGLSYNLHDLVATIQPLRQRIAAASQVGLGIFDAQLSTAVAAMAQETNWRIRGSQPGYDKYLRSANQSICGDLCAAALVAVQPNPEALWQASIAARQYLGPILRLYNDQATAGKDEREGKPNAVALLAARLGQERAGQQVSRQLAWYNTQLIAACQTGLRRQVDDPLYLLSYYLVHCAEVTRRMYAAGDFIPAEGEAR